MWLILGFAGMGLLIGNLVGLTSEKIVTPVVGLLFAFIGSSILAFLHKLSAEDRGVAGKAILALSVCCLAGVYSGVFVAEHRLLSPGALPSPAPAASVVPAAAAQTAQVAFRPGENKYLNAQAINRANEIDLKRANRFLTPEQAYDQMYQLAKTELTCSPEGGNR